MVLRLARPKRFDRDPPDMRVSVVIPVFNEAPFIETIVRRVVASPIEKEIIVVDDGSTDETPAILSRLSRELGIRILTHATNGGKGLAVRTGLAQCQGDVVLIQDADLEYDPEDCPALLKPLLERRTDIVYGSRFLGPHRATFFWHRLGNWIVTTWVNVLFNASLMDVETGYKAFRRDILQGLGLRAKGFDFEVEVTCKVLRRGGTIFEVPISYYGRSYAEGKKITWRDGIQALWIILCCRINSRY